MYNESRIGGAHETEHETGVGKEAEWLDACGSGRCAGHRRRGLGCAVPGAARASLFDLIFGGARSNARSASCQSNLKQIGLGLIQYTQDYDERYPLATSKGSEYGWAQEIQPYLKSLQIF